MNTPNKTRARELDAIDQISRGMNLCETRAELRQYLQPYWSRDLSAWLRIYRGSPHSTATKAAKIEIICGLSRKVQEHERKVKNV